MTLLNLADISRYGPDFPWKKGLGVI